MVHAPGIPIVNLHIVNLWMHTIQNPMDPSADGLKSSAPPFYPFGVLNILALVIQRRFNALVTTALAPVGPEECIVQNGVRTDPVVSIFADVYFHYQSPLSIQTRTVKNNHVAM
jgi:hypothetical protein